MGHSKHSSIPEPFQIQTTTLTTTWVTEKYIMLPLYLVTPSLSSWQMQWHKYVHIANTRECKVCAGDKGDKEKVLEGWVWPTWESERERDMRKDTSEKTHRAADSKTETETLTSPVSSMEMCLPVNITTYCRPTTETWRWTWTCVSRSWGSQGLQTTCFGYEEHTEFDTWTVPESWPGRMTKTNCCGKLNTVDVWLTLSNLTAAKSLTHRGYFHIFANRFLLKFYITCVCSNFAAVCVYALWYYSIRVHVSALFCVKKCAQPHAVCASRCITV